jgi:hypothetical protein
MMHAGASTPDRGTALGFARKLVLSLALAYVLVLQSLLGGLAAGAMASAAVDPGSAVHIICRGASADLPEPTDPAHHTPDCCLLGCPGATGTAMAPGLASVPAPAATFAFAEPASIGTQAAPAASLPSPDRNAPRAKSLVSRIPPVLAARTATGHSGVLP